MAKAKTPRRTWTRNIWGNVVGYQGGQRAEEFGCAGYADAWAAYWATGMDREAAEGAALDAVCSPGFKLDYTNMRKR